MTRVAGSTGHLHDHDVIDQFIADIRAGTLYPANPEEVIVFNRQYDISVTAGKTRYLFPFAVRILGISASVNTSPTGADVIFDVNKNGTTIFTNQTNRPRISAGTNATASEVTSMDVTLLAANDYLTVDIDQIGSTIPGADATVFIRYRKV